MTAALSVSHFTDCTLIVEGKVVEAHKAIICTRCDYFRGLLTSGLQESKQSQVLLRDIHFPVFETIRHFLYTHKLQLSGEINLEELVAMSSLYMLEELKHLCEKEIKKMVSLENVSEVMRIAQMYDLSKLRHYCVAFLNENPIDDNNMVG